jgi:CubicO group peptidase (beta-lactamase class C family)
MIVEPRVAETASVAWATWSDGWRVSYGETSPSTVFDLASVTKPLTATVLARLVADGRLSWSATVSELLPELRGTALEDANVEALLSHRAGCPAWGALYLRDPWGSPEPRSLPPDSDFDKHLMLQRAASRIERSASSIYSDIGYVLAGEIAARLGGTWAEVTGIGNAAFARATNADFDARVAPTERSAWRGDVRGAVHDENAWALERVGGSPGHAGAFATVLDVMRFAIGWADAVAGRAGILPTELARFMIAERANGSHRIGWDGRSGERSSSGRFFGPRTFGHLGFTGTSVWIDPDAQRIAVLLTNRTWPTRANLAIRAARPLIHDALWELG